MLTEIYIDQDERLYKIKRLAEDIIFRYEELLQEEIDSLTYYYITTKVGKQKSAGFLDKPAADFGARTTTQDSTQGGDILQDV
jgi:hypothetical protein